MSHLGELCVLNTGAGDIKVTFNHLERSERDRAISMLKDMQLRGYAILLQLEDGSYARAESFDADRGVYIINAPNDNAAVVGSDSGKLNESAPSPPEQRRRGRPAKQAIPVENARAIAVGRSAGG